MTIRSAIDLLQVGSLTDKQFAWAIEIIAFSAIRETKLVELLAEEHPIYREKSSSEVDRMRGWIFHQLSLSPLPEAALVFVLEELETGTDPYSVAAAAKALRSHPNPTNTFSSFVFRGMQSIRYANQPISFAAYGEFAMGPNCNCALSELIETLGWLGEHATGILEPLQVMVNESKGWSRSLRTKANGAISLIQSYANTHSVQGKVAAHANETDCCELPAPLRGIIRWPIARRPKLDEIANVVFEDHTGRTTTYAELTAGQPTVVVFFYTRCDNPLKCSLTISKLIEIQKSLRLQGLDERVHTLAITYDPLFDTSPRLARYVADRQMVLNENHRMVRCIDDFEKLQKFFGLGVNFVGSIINRHRIEVFVTDQEGRPATSFQRLHWRVEEVIASALNIPRASPEKATDVSTSFVTIAFTSIAPIVIAFFPKCPLCWAAYLSVFGMVGLERVPYLPWVRELLIALMAVNLICVWYRARSTNRHLAFSLAFVGTICLLGGGVLLKWTWAIWPGIASTMLGVFWCALPKHRSLNH